MWEVSYDVTRLSKKDVFGFTNYLDQNKIPYEYENRFDSHKVLCVHCVADLKMTPEDENKLLMILCKFLVRDTSRKEKLDEKMYKFALYTNEKRLDFNEYILQAFRRINDSREINVKYDVVTIADFAVIIARKQVEDQKKALKMAMEMNYSKTFNIDEALNIIKAYFHDCFGTSSIEEVCEVLREGFQQYKQDNPVSNKGCDLPDIKVDAEVLTTDKAIVVQEAQKETMKDEETAKVVEKAVIDQKATIEQHADFGLKYEIIQAEEKIINAMSKAEMVSPSMGFRDFVTAALGWLVGNSEWKYTHHFFGTYLELVHTNKANTPKENLACLTEAMKICGPASETITKAKVAYRNRFNGLFRTTSFKVVVAAFYGAFEKYLQMLKNNELPSVKVVEEQKKDAPVEDQKEEVPAEDQKEHENAEGQENTKVQKKRAKKTVDKEKNDKKPTVADTNNYEDIVSKYPKCYDIASSVKEEFNKYTDAPIDKLAIIQHVINENSLIDDAVDKIANICIESLQSLSNSVREEYKLSAYHINFISKNLYGMR